MLSVAVVEYAQQNHLVIPPQTFDLAERKADIDSVVRDNTFMAELQQRIVPLIVEHATFWRRYFYRLHLLKEMHAQRALLAARAAAPPEEEVRLLLPLRLTWKRSMQFCR